MGGRKSRVAIRLLSVCFPFALALPTFTSALPQDPASLLLDAFSSRCESQGRFTARALSETNALEGVLRTLLEDPECKALGPVLASMTGLNGQLQNLNDIFWSSNREGLEFRLERLNLYLSLAKTPEETSALASEMAQTRILILEGDTTEQQRKNIAKVMAANQMGRYLEVVGEAYPRLSTCFERNKYLPFQMGGHLISLAGGFTWNPAAYAALTIGGRLISSLFNYLADKKFTDAIKKIRGAKLQVGLSCAMESLEKSVCDIRDQKNLLRLHEAYRKQKSIPPEWKGYDLFRRQYPIVQDFLRQVEAGADPNSEMQGSKRADFREMEGSFRASVALTDGRLAEAARKLELLGSDASQKASAKQILVTLIDKLPAALGVLEMNSYGIFAQTVPSPEQAVRFKLWLLIGTPSPDIGSTEHENPYQYYLNRVLEGDIDLAQIQANWKNLQKAARIQLDLKKTLVLNPDPQGAIASWAKSSTNLGSAGQAMDEIIVYLKDLEKIWRQQMDWFPNSYEQRDQLALVTDTRRRFEEVVRILHSESSISPTASVDEAKEIQSKLRSIMEVMNLEEQDQVITNRMRDIVQMDLEKRLKAGALIRPDNLEASIRVANEDVLVGLYTQSAQFLNRIQRDLTEAEVLSKFNLKNFYDFFLNSLVKSLEDLELESKLWKENRDGAYSVKLSKLCLLALNAPQLSEKSFKPILKLCQGRKLEVQLEGKSIQLSFDDFVSEKLGEPDMRICAHRDFQNQVDLQELLQPLQSKY